MIIKAGYEVYPLDVKRIYRGDRLVYYRQSKLAGENTLVLDLGALLSGRPSTPASGGSAVQLSVTADLLPREGAPAQTMPTLNVSVDGDLYVKETAPVSEMPPLSLYFESEAASPDAALLGKTGHPFTLQLDGAARAPDAVPASQSTPLGVALVGTPVGPAAAPIETAEAGRATEFCPVLFTEAQAGASKALPVVVVLPVDAIEVTGPVTRVAASALHPFRALELLVEAELWIKPSQWISPVLRNNVLGVTQASKAIHEGSLLKIY